MKVKTTDQANDSGSGSESSGFTPAAIWPLVLKDLPLGRWRELTPAEIFALRRATDNQNRGKQ
jgi:hypothetical protein